MSISGSAFLYKNFNKFDIFAGDCMGVHCMEEQNILYKSTCFEAIFRKYYPSLLGFVERHVGDRDLAKDFVQDVFFKLYERKDEFASEATLKSWLFTASRNAALDYLRHLKVRDRHLLLMAESMMYVSEVDEAVSEELTLKINRAIDSLPLQCRQIIRMNVVEGKKYNEIADELNISINTIRTQISRGYRKLRVLLADDSKALILLFYRLCHFPGVNN